MHSRTLYPILRLVIPMAAGIFFAHTCHLQVSSAFIAACLLGCLCLLLVIPAFANYSYRWFYGIVLMALFFGIGCLRMQLRQQEVAYPWHSVARTYEAELMDYPIEKARSYLCRTEVHDKQVWLYLPKDSLTRSLKIGQHLLFHARISLPESISSASDEFDYASYLQTKGVSGTAYVSEGRWKIKDVPESCSLKQYALMVRQSLMEEYRRWGMEGQELAVLSALTIGYKAELDDDVRASYSEAGISHVLALSGMHIAFIWMLIQFLLAPLSLKRNYRIVKWAVSTLLIWAFAFIAGLEASVVRAVIMCMLMELGSLSESKPLSMNTLGIAAFFMLLYNPFYLFDVGFQLSFLAVASIICFYPFIYGIFQVRHKAVRYVWSVVSVSLSAQIGTFPLVAYYFSNIPVYSIIGSLVAGLLVPLIIFVTFGCLILARIPVCRYVAIGILHFLVKCLNDFAVWVSRLPMAVIGDIRAKSLEVCCMYLLILLILWYLHERSRKVLILIMFVVALFLAVHTYMLYTLN